MCNHVFKPLWYLCDGSGGTSRVYLEDELWQYVEAYAYENRIGKTDAFNLIIRTFMENNPIGLRVKE